MDTQVDLVDELDSRRVDANLANEGLGWGYVNLPFLMVTISWKQAHRIYIYNLRNLEDGFY